MMAKQLERNEKPYPRHKQEQRRRLLQKMEPKSQKAGIVKCMRQIIESPMADSEECIPQETQFYFRPMILPYTNLQETTTLYMIPFSTLCQPASRLKVFSQITFHLHNLLSFLVYSFHPSLLPSIQSLSLALDWP